MLLAERSGLGMKGFLLSRMEEFILDDLDMKIYFGSMHANFTLFV